MKRAAAGSRMARYSLASAAARSALWLRRNLELFDPRHNRALGPIQRQTAFAELALLARLAVRQGRTPVGPSDLKSVVDFVRRTCETRSQQRFYRELPGDAYVACVIAYVLANECGWAPVVGRARATRLIRAAASGSRIHDVWRAFELLWCADLVECGVPFPLKGRATRAALDIFVTPQATGVAFSRQHLYSAFHVVFFLTDFGAATPVGRTQRICDAIRLQAARWERSLWRSADIDLAMEAMLARACVESPNRQMRRRIEVPRNLFEVASANRSLAFATAYHTHLVILMTYLVFRQRLS